MIVEQHIITTGAPVRCACGGELLQYCVSCGEPICEDDVIWWPVECASVEGGSISMPTCRLCPTDLGDDHRQGKALGQDTTGLAGY